MMRPILYLLPLVIAACQPVVMGEGGVGGPRVAVPPGEVRVAAVDVTPSRLTLRLTNGARCRADRPEGVPGNWSGTTSGEDCGYQLPFRVFFREGAVPQRFTIEVPTAGTGPRAEVFVTDVDGVQRLFASPLGSNVRFEPQV